MSFRRYCGFGSLVTTLSLLQRACAWQSLPLAKSSHMGMQLARSLAPPHAAAAGAGAFGWSLAGKRNSPFRARMMSSSVDGDKPKDSGLPVSFHVDGQDVPLCDLGKLVMADPDAWRPTADDVDRISFGKPAKKKMTGSRGVPHRLNEEERFLYDMAKRKGFVEVGGSGWRKQRRGAPLINTFRSWCDSKGVPAICVFKGSTGTDEVVIDLSPLRMPHSFSQLSIMCADAFPGCTNEALEGGAISDTLADSDGGDASLASAEEGELIRSSGVDVNLDEALLTAYIKEPIHRLPMYTSYWEVPRSEAKALAKELGGAFGVPEASGKAGGGTGQRGMPNVKAGKNRRHGGFGIGGKAKKVKRGPSGKGNFGGDEPSGGAWDDESAYLGAE